MILFHFDCTLICLVTVEKFSFISHESIFKGTLGPGLFSLGLRKHMHRSLKSSALFIFNSSGANSARMLAWLELRSLMIYIWFSLTKIQAESKCGTALNLGMK